MAIDERKKLAFDAATETVKQLLTLGTAAIGGVIALFDEKDVAGIQFGSDTAVVLTSLFVLGLGVVSGLLGLGAIAGQLGSPEISEPSTYAPPVRFFTAAQMILFGFGIGVAMLAVL